MLVFFFLFTGHHFEILFHFAVKKTPEIIIHPATFCSSATSADRFYRIDKAQVESPLRSSSVQPSAINKYKFGGFHLDAASCVRLCERVHSVCLQEHLHFVTEICQDEVFILDHEGPPLSQGPSTGMPDLVVEPAAG